MTLMNQYETAILGGEIDDDPLQREILVRMQRLANDLKKANSSWIYRLGKPYIKGLYLYGPIGAGKTYLVDLFYEHVEENKKARFHFHHFMQQIDVQLRRLQGQKIPYGKLLKNWQSRFVCCVLMNF